MFVLNSTTWEGRTRGRVEKRDTENERYRTTMGNLKFLGTTPQRPDSRVVTRNDTNRRDTMFESLVTGGKRSHYGSMGLLL